MSYPTCPNCGSSITCGCQRRTASDGNQCCGSCILKYEKDLLGKKEPGNNTSTNFVTGPDGKVYKT